MPVLSHTTALGGPDGWCDLVYMRLLAIILLALCNVTAADCRSVAPSPAPATGTPVVTLPQSGSKPATDVRAASCVPPETASAASGSLSVEVVPVLPWCDGTARWRLVFSNPSNQPIAVPVNAADPPSYTGSAFLELSRDPSYGLSMLPNAPSPGVELSAHDTVSVTQEFYDVAERAGPWNAALELRWDTHEVSVSFDYLLRLSEQTECLRVCRGAR